MFKLGGGNKGLKNRVKKMISNENMFLMFLTIPRLSIDLDTSVKMIQRWKRRNKASISNIYGGIHQVNGLYHYHAVIKIIKRVSKQRLEKGLNTFIDLRRVYSIDGVLTYISNSEVQLYDSRIMDYD